MGYWDWFRQYVAPADGQKYYNEHYAEAAKNEITSVPGNIGIDLKRNGFQDWLYSAEDWDTDDYYKFYMLYSLPVFSSYIDTLYDKRAQEEYFKRYGMDYSDVHDPRKLMFSNSARNLVSGSMNFVSRNLTRLYR